MGDKFYVILSGSVGVVKDDSNTADVGVVERIGFAATAKLSRAGSGKVSKWKRALKAGAGGRSALASNMTVRFTARWVSAVVRRVPTL